MTDFVVVGAGMAGASAAFFLAEHGEVVLLEREARPGYHSTGRSAALYTQAYGNTAIRALTIAGKPFFDTPPEGFADHPVLSPRGALFVAREDQLDALAAATAEARALVPNVRAIAVAEARALVPVLREDYVAAGSHEPDAMDIDVDALHQGFLRGVRARGGRIVTDAEVTALEPAGGGWRIETAAGTFEAPVVVNAAGAWADVVAEMADCRTVGLVPKRRTAILFDPPDGVDIARWPITVDVDEEFYFKPDAGRILASPADETPVPPQDVQPDELDVAIAVDRIQHAADLPVRRIEHRWAGLRSFVADKTPVVGFDPERAGFFWLAGQGGYGIQTAPAMGRLAAALATGREIPSDMTDRGLTAAMLSPARLRQD